MAKNNIRVTYRYCRATGGRGYALPAQAPDCLGGALLVPQHCIRKQGPLFSSIPFPQFWAVCSLHFRKDYRKHDFRFCDFCFHHNSAGTSALISGTPGLTRPSYWLGFGS